jgi:hypothetical protein
VSSNQAGDAQEISKRIALVENKLKFGSGAKGFENICKRTNRFSA